MKKLLLMSIVAMTILTMGGVTQAQADARYVRRQGYQPYHYAPRTYRSHDRVIYRRGYPGPTRGYYRYGTPHYQQRGVYINFFGIPIITR